MSGASSLRMVLRPHRAFPTVTGSIRAYNSYSSSRSIHTWRSARPRLTPTQASLRQSGRRFQSEQAAPKKKRGTFRSLLLWGWLLTYVSALGGLVYVTYGIISMRYPADQEEPDPK